MHPTLSSGQIVFFSSLLRPSNGSIVLSNIGGKDLVKRLSETSGRFSLRGDNRKDSHDLEDVRLGSIEASLIYPHK